MVDSLLMRHYFVDEAGDAVLFDARGRVIIGNPGCSRYFMLGLLDIADPTKLESAFMALRSELMSDPYLNSVPSMKLESGKTAVAFHAKDDLPEVRHRVFTLLMSQDVRFYAVVKDKAAVLSYVQTRNSIDGQYKYTQNELYEHLGRRLFRDRLHKDDGYKVCFARRGSADRTRALGDAALSGARANFAEKHGVFGTAPIEVTAANLEDSVGLQAVDYFLWAIQRLYEKREHRYAGYIWGKVALVHDVDDTRKAKYGVYYTRDNPLTLDTIKEK